MSWDLFVQDLPPDLRSVSEIPADFSPKALGSRAWVLAAIAEAVPFADYADPTWIRVDSPEANLEINLGREDPVVGFTLHVRGGSHVVGLVADILTKLRVRAVDPNAETGLFDLATAEESLRQWQAYRDGVISAGTPNNRWRGP